MADLLTAVQLSPDYIQPHAFLAMTYEAEDNPWKNYRRAVDEYSAAISAPKALDIIWNDKIPEEMASPEAIRTLSYKERGKLYLNMGRFDLANSDFDTALQRIINNDIAVATVPFRLAIIHVCKGYALQHMMPPDDRAAEKEFALARRLLYKPDHNNLTEEIAACLSLGTIL
jgi:tetratricopeptide (TPR) repeat protein